MPVLSWAHMSCGVWLSEGHQEDSWSPKGSAMAAGVSCRSHQARPPPAARTWVASAGVMP